MTPLRELEETSHEVRPPNQWAAVTLSTETVCPLLTDESSVQDKEVLTVVCSFLYRTFRATAHRILHCL